VTLILFLVLHAFNDGGDMPLPQSMLETQTALVS